MGVLRAQLPLNTGSLTPPLLMYPVFFLCIMMNYKHLLEIYLSQYRDLLLVDLAGRLHVSSVLSR